MRLKWPYILFLVVLVSACETDDEAFIGPELAVAGDDFLLDEPFTVSQSVADFENDTVFFSASFSERVSWTITVTGTISGATKEFSGIGTEIDSTVYWTGETNRVISELSLFRIEPCVATLEILGADDLESKSIEIIRTRSYGFLLNDFEEADALTSPWFGPNAGDLNFFEEVGSELGSPQGDSYLRLSGNDHDNDFFIGSSGFNNVAPIFKGASVPSADSLYLNIYVYGDGPESTSKLEIKIDEGDGDSYVMTVIPRHTGWQFFSAKYSDLIIPSGFDVGDNVHSTNNIRLVSFLLTSDPSGNPGEVKFDYPVWTTDQPLLNDEDI